MFNKLLVWLGFRKAIIEQKIDEVKAEATKTLDINKDGKVDAQDFKAAVEEVKTEVKKEVEEVKTKVEAEVKKVKVGRKPKTSTTSNQKRNTKRKLK